MVSESTTSIQQGEQVHNECNLILVELQRHDAAQFFVQPTQVDGSLLASPLNLADVSLRHSQRVYESPWRLAEHVVCAIQGRLIAEAPGNAVHQAADQLKAVFGQLWEEHGIAEQWEQWEQAGAARPQARTCCCYMGLCMLQHACV
jgi:hypothetical protein